MKFPRTGLKSRNIWVTRVSLACDFNPTFSPGKIELVSVLDFPEDLLPDLDREMTPDDGDPVIKIDFRHGPGVAEVALERSQLSAGMVLHVKNEIRGKLDRLVDSIQIIQNIRVILAHKKTLCQIRHPPDATSNSPLLPAARRTTFSDLTGSGEH